MTPVDLPLTGVRVLDYSQYVAGPLATMLLADLGADVIKVEPPSGDAWRHYAPHAPDESRYFYALNRNKRSVVIDLKTERGRRQSRDLIGTADAMVHNFPPDRARRFELDPESLRSTDSDVVVGVVSAFGSVGPDSNRRGYDVIAQALSGLLMADVRPYDEVPRRSGGIPAADITAGLLTAISVLAGLAQRPHRSAHEFEVSLYGAALVMQLQDFVQLESQPSRPSSSVTRPVLEARAGELACSEELEPYYRAYETADGFVVLACLNVKQRRLVLSVLDLDDPWVENPQAPPDSAVERAQRMALVDAFARRFRTRRTAEWERELAGRGVPAGRVRQLNEVFEDEQANRNGLVQTVCQQNGPVRLLGNVFKCDGQAVQAERPAPRLGEHTDAVLGDPRTPRESSRRGPLETM